MVDTSDRDRAARAQEELHKIISDPELEHSPILIFANKQDVAGAMS